MKPKCKLVGTDGNVFALASRVIRALKDAGLREQAKEFENRLLKCKSYEESLRLMLEYVDEGYDDCPNGHKMGDDFDLYGDCEDCKLYRQCEDLSDVEE